MEDLYQQLAPQVSEADKAYYASVGKKMYADFEYYTDPVKDALRLAVRRIECAIRSGLAPTSLEEDEVKAIETYYNISFDDYIKKLNS